MVIIVLTSCSLFRKRSISSFTKHEYGCLKYCMNVFERIPASREELCPNLIEITIVLAVDG